MICGLRGIGLGSTVDTIASAIQQFEGWFPGSVSYRNNNPGNLMYVGQAGATGADSRGYAIFPDYATGYQATVDQINRYMARGITSVQGIISTWAPGNAPGNTPVSTQNYINSVSAALGIDPNADVSGGGGAAASESNPLDLSGGFSGFSPDLSAIDTTTIAVAAGTLLFALWIFNR